MQILMLLSLEFFGFFFIFDKCDVYLEWYLTKMVEIRNHSIEILDFFKGNLKKLQIFPVSKKYF